MRRPTRYALPDEQAITFAQARSFPRWACYAVPHDPCPCMHLSEALLCLSTASAYSPSRQFPPTAASCVAFLKAGVGMQLSELLRKHGELALGYITQVRSP